MLTDETSLFIQLHTLYHAYNDHLIKSSWWIVIVFDMLEKKYKAQNKIQGKGKKEDRNENLKDISQQLLLCIDSQ